MKYPKPFWPGHFSDSTWIGLLNWYVLRWVFLRLYCGVEEEYGDVNEIGLLFVRPKALYDNQKYWSRKIIFWKRK